MMYVKSLDIYVNKVEDLRDKIAEDVYEVVESLANGAVEEIYDNYKNLKDEFEVYEQSLEECRATIIEQVGVLHDTNQEISSLIYYLTTANRIDRDKIYKSLRKINLVDIADKLNLSI